MESSAAASDATPAVGTGPAQTEQAEKCAADETVTFTPEGYFGEDSKPLKDALQEFYPLMEMDKFTAKEVQSAIAYRGYFPADTPLANLPDDFIRGVLIGAWDQVKAMVENMREDNDLPF